VSKELIEKMNKESIVIYKTVDGKIELDIQVSEETVWLTQDQIAVLFGTQRPAITKHLGNIFKSGELNQKSVSSILERTARDGKIYKTKFYNLDAILSVGYRVNSRRATRFRIWANKVLKEYLVKGYALNEKRLKEQNEKVKELEKSLEIFKKVANSYQLKQDEFSGILKVITDYTYALDILDQYDHKKLKIIKVKKKEEYKINYKDSIELIKGLRKKFSSSDLFGKEKDKSFQSTVGTLYQTFNKKELYPSIEEKSAMLLYLTIKNHSFVDENKRIAAALFLMYLDRNKYLYSKRGEKRIADNALVALCLMIAESNAKEMDTIVKVVINLINSRN
jgi:prophage maintenance system killer protein